MKPMTKQQIGQYKKLQREIAMLEDRIFEAESSGEYVSDVVQGSMKHPPYAVHNVVIKGYGSSAIPKLAAKKAQRIAECETIEEYIDGLDDSLMRQLLTRRYIEGHTLEETAELVGYSETHVKRLLKDFFAKDDL
ncbi:hypothetical protein LJC74_03175 [Eubacteriales bacterium OttesenSCG-928-A19]|nr:hypothetical protein [Eubacteriales bacterium OttesenSCG-928-A19]